MASVATQAVPTYYTEHEMVVYRTIAAMDKNSLLCVPVHTLLAYSTSDCMLVSFSQTAIFLILELDI